MLRREAADVTDVFTDVVNPFAPLQQPIEYEITIVDVGQNSLTRRPDSAALAWAKAGIMATPNGVKPEPTDKMVINGRSYTFVQIEPLTPNPDGLTVLYEWMAKE